MSDIARACADLLARSFPEGGSWSEQDIDAVLESPGGHLFEVDGGFLIAKSVLDEAEVWTIAVAPEMRRQGRARMLLEKAARELAELGVEKLFLEVAEDNAGARALYEMSGFTESGRRRNYYRSKSGARMDAILLQKKLP